MIAMENSLGNKEVMAKNITRFMQEKGVNRADFSRALGFNYNTVSDWIHAKTYPRIDKIETMARYFGVTKADLVEPPAPAAPSTPPDADAPRAPEYMELHRIIDELPERDVSELLNTARFKKDQISNDKIHTDDDPDDF